MNSRFLKVMLALALGAAGCGDGGDPAPTVEDDLFGLDDVDALLEGSSSNADLTAEGKADEVLPAQFDLIATQSPIKSQGGRGVCSIFGTTAYMEHLYISEGTLMDPDFSEQFLQWSSKFEGNSFPATGGSSASVNLSALRRFGSVFEADWPYESSKWGTSDDARCDGEDTQPTECYTNGAPPMEALMAQRWFLPSGGRWISSRANSLKSHMFNTNTAVQAGGTFFYQSWGHGGSRIPRYTGYRSQGYVLAPNAADIESSNMHRAGHSFLLVGWDDDLEVQSVDAEGNLAVDEMGEPIMQKGFFLFKNSWGTGWAEENPFGAGYGWLSYEYVEDHLRAYIAEAPELALTELCGDERDNDFNGQTDCADAACAMDRSCIDPSGSWQNNTPIAIPDNDTAGASSIIDVTEMGTLSGVSVAVDITHPYRGDLTVTLSKGGTTVTLFEREDAGADDLVRTFDVSEFDGMEAFGTWTLNVIDNANSDTGTLNAWSMELTTCAGGDCGSMPTTINGMNETLQVIPDDDASGITSDISITDGGTIATVRVTVNITHTFIGDLVIAVSKDGGSAIELLREDLVEGSMLMRTFTVDGLVGADAAGTYSLQVSDVAGSDEGTLNGWSIEILTE